jgi:tRNA G10  N-methylase Trm11
MQGFKDKEFDLAIVDPPYGINMAMGHKGSEKRGIKTSINHLLEMTTQYQIGSTSMNL